MFTRYLFTLVVFVLWVVSFYLAANMGGVDLIEEFMQASPSSILLGFVFYGIAVSTGIFVLRRCLIFAGQSLPFRGVAKAWMFGAFIDNVSPTVAPLGQVGITYFLWRFYKVAYPKSVAAIGMYITSWGVSAGIYSTFAILLVHISSGIPKEYTFFVLIALSFYLVSTIIWFSLITNKGLIKKVARRFVVLFYRIRSRFKHDGTKFEEKVYDTQFEHSYSSLGMVMKNKGHLLTSIALFWIPQIGQVLCLYFMILGFGINISLLDLLMVHIVSSLIGMLSIIPSGLFVYETAVVGLTEVVAPGAGGAILAAVLLYRLIFVWTTNLIGGLVGITQGIKKIEKIALVDVPGANLGN